jgi:hypothetical protein
MTDVVSLRRSLDYSRKQTAFAWAKFYETTRGRLTADYTMYNRMTTMDARSDTHIPQHIVDELKEMGATIKKTWECPVCIEMIKPENLDITNCGHYFCKECLAGVKSRAVAQNVDCKCPVCRRGIKTG